jgi:hypothetical protein
LTLFLGNIFQDDDKKRKSSSGRLNSSDTRIRGDPIEKKGKDSSRDSSRGKSKERDGERSKERNNNKQEVLKEQVHMSILLFMLL